MNHRVWVLVWIPILNQLHACLRCVVQVWFLCKASSSSSIAAFQQGWDRVARVLCGSRGILAENIEEIKAYLGLGLIILVFDRVIIGDARLARWDRVFIGDAWLCRVWMLGGLTCMSDGVLLKVWSDMSSCPWDKVWSAVWTYGGLCHVQRRCSAGAGWSCCPTMSEKELVTLLETNVSDGIWDRGIVVDGVNAYESGSATRVGWICGNHE
jgi:hypothetical protein